MQEQRIIYKGPGDGWSVFLIIDWVSANIKEAMAVGMGNMLAPEHNKIRNLPGDIERFILAHFNDQIKDLRKNGTKHFVVMDISSFPYVTSKIDLRDHSAPDDPNDKFDNDMSNLWNNYSMEKTITVLVNMNLPFTGLKHISNV